MPKKLAKVISGTVENTILVRNTDSASDYGPDYFECAPETGIGWKTLDNGLTFIPPDPPTPDLEEYRSTALDRIEAFEDEELKDILGKTLGHKTVATLIRFMAAAAYDAGTATAGQIARIENEATQRGINPATMAASAATNFNNAQGKMGNLDGILKMVGPLINNASSIAEIDQALQNAVAAWDAL